MAFIYKITNTQNQKTYFGAVTKSIEHRWRCHKWEALKDNSNTYFHRALRKYGPENFIIEQMYEHENTDFVFKVMEPFFIALYESMYNQNGYNIATGGQGAIGVKMSQDAKDNLSRQRKGIKLSPEHCKAISDAQKGKPTWNKGKLCPQISEGQRGKIHSEEVKHRMSQAHVGNVHTQETKDKIKDKIAEKFIVQEPDGAIVTGVNLRQYCIDKTISQGNLTYLHHTKDYKLLQITKIVRIHHIKNIKTNNVETTDNLAAYCKNLNFSNASLLTKYRQNKSYKDWQIINVEYSEKVENYNNYKG